MKAKILHIRKRQRAEVVTHTITSLSKYQDNDFHEYPLQFTNGQYSAETSQTEIYTEP